VSTKLGSTGSRCSLVLSYGLVPFR
jgi:hypothetical protein